MGMSWSRVQRHKRREKSGNLGLLPKMAWVDTLIEIL